MLKIGVLVSGNGTNLQSIIDNCEMGNINGAVACVISSSEKAYALQRAKAHNIPAYCVRRKNFPSAAAFEKQILERLCEHGACLTVLAGYLIILSEYFITNAPGPVINVHPSLIPSFCGVGLYGLKVHEAALAAGVKITGATVHFVTSECDAGPIILQETVAVEPGDTPETLQKRVLEEAEWQILPQAIQMIANGEI